MNNVQHISEPLAAERLARLVKEISRMRKHQIEFYVHRVSNSEKYMKQAQVRVDALVKLETSFLRSKQLTAL